MQKVLILAFGHPDNVLSLAYHLAEKVDLSVLFVVSGDRFRQGVIDMDISGLEYGLVRDKEKVGAVLPESIAGYSDGRFHIWLLRTYDRKILKDKRLRNFRLIRKACSRINRSNFDVIHFNGASGFLFYFYYLLPKRRMPWTLHDYKAHSGEKNRTAALINHFFVRRKRILIVQHYKFLKAAVEETFKVAPDKVWQIYSGPFDIFKAFQPLEIGQKGYALFFGRISPYKGVDKLLEAFFELVQNEAFPYKLIVAGSGHLWFDDSKYSNCPNIEIRNRYIPTEELAGLINNAAITVVPYTDATHSGVVMTSYAFNKPVIASDVDGLKEVVIDQQTGTLIKPNDKQALKTALNRLLTKEETLRAFSRNISALQDERLDWDIITNRYLELYERCDKG